MQMQAEEWPEIENELAPLLALHCKEMGLPGHALDLDRGCYAEAHRAGRLVVIVARDHGEAVGYYSSFLARHPHYDLMVAAMDVYFLLETYRNGPNAGRLFGEMEKECRRRGATLLLSTVRPDVSPGAAAIFERLGWHASRIVYQKELW